MSTLEKIRSDWIAARKAKDQTKANLLGTLIGQISTKEKTFNPARTMTEAEVITEVRKLLGSVVETGEVLKTASGRDEQRAQNAIERQTLDAYMPQQMSEADIEAFAQAKKAEGANMGAIMTALRTERPGEYDGKLASSVVKRVLAG